jgi:hypothetical protein
MNTIDIIANFLMTPRQQQPSVPNRDSKVIPTQSHRPVRILQPSCDYYTSCSQPNSPMEDSKSELTRSNVQNLMSLTSQIIPGIENMFNNGLLQNQQIPTREKHMDGVEIIEKVVKQNQHDEIVIYVVIKNGALLDILKNIVTWQEIYDSIATVPMNTVLCSLQTIKAYNRKNRNQFTIQNENSRIANNIFDCTQKFIELIEHYNKEQLVTIKSMLLRGKISYDALWYLFSGDKEIVCDIQGEKSAGQVVDVQYQNSYIRNFSIRYTSYVNIGESYRKNILFQSISPFKGVKNIKDLPVQLISNEIKEELRLRGLKYVNLVKSGKPQHKLYDGNMLIHSSYGYCKIPASGKIMVDIKGYHDNNPDNSRIHYNELYETVTELSNDVLWSTYPYIYGHGLTKGKRWGEVAVSGISDIIYNDRAYEDLYLPEIKGTSKKKLIVNFILNKDNFVKDSVGEKGGGIVFLLHGPPGVGKTLTAEATAEILHAPLYYVSAADIGVTADDVAHKLENILSLSERWKAPILIDEADIFVEKRTTTDIKRNALVGTFLRLLEYHNGIIFLTTNRVTDFDEAIMNRIHVKFEYSTLSKEGRFKIWDSLIKKLTVEHKIDINKISDSELNGRQIRTCLNLSLCLAKSENKMLNTKHILTIVEMNC